MNKLTLTEQEITDTKALLAELSSKYRSAEDEQFLTDVSVYAHELPRRVRAALNDFRLQENHSGICLISGYPIDEAKIGRTHAHWQLKPREPRELEEEMLLLLFGSLLGDTMGWSTQQDGRIVHDVMPIREHEHEQLGSSSQELLTWHTEDAFHPYRCDYLGMMCLRNPDQVATTVCSISDIPLDEIQTDVLFQSRFTIQPDESHLRKNRSPKSRLSEDNSEQFESSYDRIELMNSDPEKIAVLFGHPTAPYIRIDPYFMHFMQDDEQGQAALNELVRVVDSRISDLVLQPGDCVFLDNYRVVHGRKPFQARYEGDDRWLKRISLARDLRKSRAARPAAMSRIIF
jgi:Fe(II)/alpha-ketoglutarate-dependent arginine beta-hydroxylase